MICSEQFEKELLLDLMDSYNPYVVKHASNMYNLINKFKDKPMCDCEKKTEYMQETLPPMPSYAHILNNDWAMLQVLAERLYVDAYDPTWSGEAKTNKLCTYIGKLHELVMRIKPNAR